MPGYIMHLAEGMLLEKQLREQGYLKPEDHLRFTAGLLLPDTLKKKAKIASHFWREEDLDHLAIPPSLERFLGVYGSMLEDPLLLGYYAHLHLDREFVCSFWPENFRFLGEDGQEKVLSKEICTVELVRTGLQIPEKEFFSDVWYYGDYSRMNAWFHDKYGMEVPVFEPLPEVPVKEVRARDLTVVTGELRTLFDSMDVRKKEQLKVFTPEGLDSFISCSADRFMRDCVSGLHGSREIR